MRRSKPRHAGTDVTTRRSDYCAACAFPQRWERHFRNFDDNLEEVCNASTRASIFESRIAVPTPKYRRILACSFPAFTRVEGNRHLRAHVSLYSSRRSDEPFEHDYHAVVLSRTFKVIRETTVMVALSRWRGIGRQRRLPYATNELKSVTWRFLTLIFEFMRSRVYTYRT